MYSNRSMLPALITLIAIAAFMPASAQEPAFGERAGDEIDAAERGYFDLFPRITSFERATGVVGNDGSLIITITRRSAGDTTIPLDPSRAGQLRHYLDNLEQIYREERAVDWSLLGDLVRPGQPFGEGRTVWVRLRTGDRYHGVLLHASERAVVLARSAEGYRWETADTSVVVLPASSIDRISRPNEIYVGLGAGLAVGIAGSLVAYNASDRDGLVTTAAFIVPITLGTRLGEFQSLEIETDGDIQRYLESLSRIRERAFFLGEAPPEIHRSIERTLRDGIASSTVQEDLHTGRELSLDRRFHLSGTFGVTGRVGAYYYTLNTAGRIAEESSAAADRIGSLTLLYTPSPLLRIGVGGWLPLPIDYEPNVEYMGLSGVMAVVDLRYMRSALASNLSTEIFGGAGFGLAWVEASGRLTSPVTGSTLDSTYHHRIAAPAFNFRVGFDLFLSEALSLQLRADARLALEVTIPETLLRSSAGTIRRIGERRIQMATQEIGLGVHYHF